MTNWHHENIAVDTIHTGEHDEFVVEIRGERFILSEREVDALMGELSVYGAQNPNSSSRSYRARDRGDTDA